MTARVRRRPDRRRACSPGRPTTPQLIGRRCRACGTDDVPAARPSVPGARPTESSERLLARTGTLWTLDGPGLPAQVARTSGPSAVRAVRRRLRRARRRGASSRRGSPTADPDELEIGDADGAGHRAVRAPTTTAPSVVTFAFRPDRDGGATMSDDVAIVGIGIHPFGRHDGRVGPAAGACTPPARRWPTPASAGTTCSSPSAAAATAATPTRWSASSA